MGKSLMGLSNCYDWRVIAVKTLDLGPTNNSKDLTIAVGLRLSLLQVMLLSYYIIIPPGNQWLDENILHTKFQRNI